MSNAAVIAGQVARRFRYDLIAIPVVAGAMALAVRVLPLQAFAGVVPLLGIVVAVFIGFRNRNAYNRWWEARTLWGAVIINARSLHYALIAYEDGTPEMAAVTDRMRRREVRHARQLAAELTGRNVSGDATGDGTGDDTGDTATALQAAQAEDIGELCRSGMIDRQARRVLVTINSAQVAADAGLERIKQQPIPRFYDLFIRCLAWFFAVIVCTRMDAGGHNTAVGIILGVLIMALVVIAERLGHVLEEPMSDDVFGLPLGRFCDEIELNLLGQSGSVGRAGAASGAGIGISE